MSSFSNIEKFIYTKNKEDVVSLLEYIIFNDERNNEKFLVFKFQNNLDQRLNQLRFEIVQYNSLGDILVKSVVEYAPNSVRGYSSFVPDAKFKAHYDCASITITLEKAVFERVYYEDGKLNPIVYSKSDFRNDFTKEKLDFSQTSKIPQEIPKQKKRDQKAKAEKRKYKIKDMTKQNKSKFALVGAIFFSVLLLAYFITTAIIYRTTATVFTIDGIDYKEIDKKTLSIEGCDSSVADVVIPAELEDKTIVNISTNAFKNSKLKSIKFSSDIVIEANAFENCKNLQTIINSNYVTRIDKEAFKGCVSLNSVSFENATIIGSNAFDGCDGVKLFNVPKATVFAGAFANTEPTEIILFDTNPNKFIKLFGDVDKTPTTLKTIKIGKTYFPNGYCEGLDSVYEFITTSNNPTFEDGALDGVQSYEMKFGFAHLNDEIVGVQPNVIDFTISSNIIDLDGAFTALKSTYVNTLTLSNSIVSYKPSHFVNLNVDTLIILSACSYIPDEALRYINASNIIINTALDANRVFGSTYSQANTVTINCPNVASNQLSPFTGASAITLKNTSQVDNGSFTKNVSLKVLEMPITNGFSLTNFGVTTGLQSLNITSGDYNFLPSDAINGYNNLNTLIIDKSYSSVYHNFISNCSSLSELVLPSVNIYGTPMGEGLNSLRKVTISVVDFASYYDINNSCRYTEELIINSNGGTLSSKWLEGCNSLRLLKINDANMNYEYDFLASYNSYLVLDVAYFNATLASSFAPNNYVNTIIIRNGTFRFSQAVGLNCDVLVFDIQISNIRFDYSTKVSAIYLEQLKPSSSINFENAFANGFYGVIFCPEVATSTIKDLVYHQQDIQYVEYTKYFN